MECFVNQIDLGLNDSHGFFVASFHESEYFIETLDWVEEQSWRDWFFLSVNEHEFIKEMEEEFKKFDETFFRVKFQVNIVQKVDDVELRLLTHIFSEQESFSFFQEGFWGLNVLVELFFEAFGNFIDDLHITVSEFIDQSGENCPS